MQIHRIGSPENAFYVNAFILEGARSVTVIDTHFLRSSTAVLQRKIEEIGKPLAAILITHPHPDHFNGAGILQEGKDVPILSTSATARVIAETVEEKARVWKPKYGDDYPDTVALPTQVIASGELLRFDDIELILHEMGPGESADNAIVHLLKADALIASDLVYSGCHPWLAEGRTAHWIAQLDEVESRFNGISRIYAGHGQEGGPELFGLQRSYLNTFRERVETRLREGGLSNEDRAKIAAETLADHPRWPLEFLVELNVEGVARELYEARP